MDLIFPPHVHFAGYHVGDQAGAVFAQQGDLLACVVDGGVNVGGFFV